MYHSELPDIDLLIRTSGEKKISNFMLWHLAYCEFVFFDVNWPDFKNFHLLYAIHEYKSRKKTKGE